MIEKPIDAITEADLRELITFGRPESRTLDYKQDLVIDGDEKRKAFLADVCAMANTAGGDIIYGISEADEGGNPAAIVGVQLGSHDVLLRKLDSIIADGIAPRVAVRMHVVPTSSGDVLVLRVAESWSGPHMVTFKSSSRFYGRRDRQNLPYDIDEIRNAFAGGSAAEERMRSVRDARLIKILANDGPYRVVDYPKLVTHVFPLHAFRHNSAIDKPRLVAAMQALEPTGDGVSRKRYNLEGCAAANDAKDGHAFAYAQFFRNGFAEMVDAILDFVPGNAKPFLPIASVHEQLAKSLKHAHQALEAAAVPLPYIVSVSLTGVRGVRIPAGRLGRAMPDQGFDRDNFVLGGHLVESVPPTETEILRILRPVLDELWQATGHMECRYYNAKGEYAPPT